MSSADMYALAQKFVELSKRQGGLCAATIDFLNNEKHRQITLVEKMGFVVKHSAAREQDLVTGAATVVAVDQQVYRSLGSVLEQHIWPEPEQASNKIKSRYPAKRTGPKNITEQYGKLSKDARCKGSGQAHGSAVHAELSTFIKEYVKVDVPGHHVLFEDPDPCTVAILHYLYKNNLLPVKDELNIWEPEMRVGTALDMLVQTISEDETKDNRKPEIWLIELKTGYEEGVYEARPGVDTPFKAPFQMFLDCPQNRHVLQLMAQACILYYNYDFVPDRMAIMRRLPKLQSTGLVELDVDRALTFFPLLKDTLKN